MTETRILLVMPQVQRARLLQHLHVDDAHVLIANDCVQARRLLKAHPTIHVILSKVGLRDGSWQTLLEEAAGHSARAAVIVCTSQVTVGFWCDVLDQGAYDLLIGPYQPEQVRAIVEAAAAHSLLRSVDLDREQI